MKKNWKNPVQKSEILANFWTEFFQSFSSRYARGHKLPTPRQIRAVTRLARVRVYGPSEGEDRRSEDLQILADYQNRPKFVGPSDYVAP